MATTNFLKLLFFTIMLLHLHIHCVHANPVTSADAAKGVEENVNELNELNELLKKPVDTNTKLVEAVEKPSKESPSFSHHDEDLPRSETNLELEESLKYDVEVLESRDIKKENVEVEERFKGASIQMNTDNFFAENIEVHGGSDGDDSIQQSHMILTIILVMVALISIGLYVALVIWRSQLEQRYGMRELLVTSDDDFCSQIYCNNDRNNSSNNNNNLNNVYNETVSSHTRPFSLGHA